MSQWTNNLGTIFWRMKSKPWNNCSPCVGLWLLLWWSLWQFVCFGEGVGGWRAFITHCLPMESNGIIICNSLVPRTRLQESRFFSSLILFVVLKTGKIVFSVLAEARLYNNVIYHPPQNGGIILLPSRFLCFLFFIMFHLFSHLLFSPTFLVKFILTLPLCKAH
jgi:hypothetical protein